MTVTLKNKGLLFLCIMATWRDSIVIVSVLLEAVLKICQVENFVKVSRTTVSAIKKWMNNNEGVNSCANSD